MEKTNTQNPPKNLTNPFQELLEQNPQDNLPNQQTKSQNLDIPQELPHGSGLPLVQPTQKDPLFTNPFHGGPQDNQPIKKENPNVVQQLPNELPLPKKFELPKDPGFKALGGFSDGQGLPKNDPFYSQFQLPQDPGFKIFKGFPDEQGQTPANDDQPFSDSSTPTNIMKEMKPLLEKGFRPNQVFPEKMKKMASGYADNKDLKESDIDYKDLVPEGVETVGDMKKAYEEKMNKKKYGNLNCFPDSKWDEKSGVIFTPDYQFIISAARFHSIKIFSVETRQLVHEIKEAHNYEITALTMTHDGKYLMSASLDRSIKIWDFASKELVHDFKDLHKGKISAIAITSDNKFLISGSWDKSVMVFDLITKQQVQHFHNYHQDRITCLGVTSDNLIITASSDKSVKIFNLRTREDIYIFKDIHKDDILSMAISKDNKFIVTGSADNSVKILDIHSKKEIYHITDEIVQGYKIGGFSTKALMASKQVTQVALSQDGQFIFAALGNHSIMMFDIKTKQKLKHFTDIHPESISDKICGLAISQDANFLVSCVNKLTLEIVQIQEKKKNLLQSDKAHDNQVVSFVFSSDSKSFISTDPEANVKVFDCKTLKEIKTYSKIENKLKYSVNGSQTVTTLVGTNDNKFLIAGTASYQINSISVFHRETGELYHQFEKIHQGEIKALTVTSDSKYIISAASSEDVVMLDIEAKKTIHHFQNLHKGQVTTVAVTPDDKFILTGSQDKSIKMLSIATKQEIYHWKDVHEDIIEAVAVTPDNKFIISSSSDFSIKIFDIETKSLVYEFLHAHPARITSLSISSDSRFVGSSSPSFIKVFDIKTKQLVYDLQVSQGSQCKTNNSLF